MAKFLLFVTSSPDDQSAYSAYKFAEAVSQSEHQLLAVFFYAQAPLVANKLTTPPSDEFNLTSAWQDLQQNSQAKLIVCSAAAQRRGMLDKSEAEYHGHQEFNLASGFEIAGLGEYVSLQTQVDKVVQF